MNTLPEINRLVRSKRRTIGLTVTEEGLLIVRAPLRTPLAQIRRAVYQKTDWITNKQAEQLARMARKPRRAYAEGETFLFLGEPYVLSYKRGLKSVRTEEGLLLLPGCAPEEAQKLLTEWYKRQARAVFYDRLQYYAPLLGVAPRSVRLSSARGRWGSCGPNNSINLVWRLVMAPLNVIDYVAVHELCHIRRRDHSAAFWKLVQGILPRYAEARRYLKEHGAELEV
ncbi:MAG TPA: SprT family zinc-dependent metalloprotease [Feifaniaceae bacterium]|nr:SprT family zinc-dependent metalloprotease [Feifaniaceae bacterium]